MFKSLCISYTHGCEITVKSEKQMSVSFYRNMVYAFLVHKDLMN